MLVSYYPADRDEPRASDSATITSTREEVDKMRELLNLFNEVPLETLHSMLLSDAGRLAYAVLCAETDSLPVKMLIDELANTFISAETNKQFVTRQAMLNELEDVLKAKTITPYRRSRINKALKRDCLKCHGSGKEPVVKPSPNRFGTRTERHEISWRSPDCLHCKGTGINPKEEKVTIGEIEISKAELEQLTDFATDDGLSNGEIGTVD